MKTNNLTKSLSRTFHTIGLGLKKHSPEILVVAGVIGAVGSAVLACKATTKLDKVLENKKNQVEQIHAYVEDNGYSEEYTEKDYKKDLTIVYTKSAIDVAKLYGPSVILGGLSIAAIFTGHNILRQRNFALAAAYTAVDTSFKKYRDNVIDRFGKDLDKELKLGFKPMEVEETVQNEDGTETTVKKTVEVMESAPLASEYARIFDEWSPCYKKDAEANLDFLTMQQRFANEKLEAKGYLFLNEVYDMLGFPRSRAGQVIGWKWKNDGSVYVDFGIHNIRRKDNSLFLRGEERAVLLDFNPTGNILGHIDRMERNARI